MKNLILALAVTGLSFVAAVVGGLTMRQAAPSSFGAIDTPIFSIQNASSTVVGTTAGQVVSTSTSRRYLKIQNTGSGPTATAYCNTNGRIAYDQSGFMLLASSTYTSYGSDLYTGSVNCISSSTIRLLVQEAF